MISEPIVQSDNKIINRSEKLSILQRGVITYIMTNDSRTVFYVGVTTDLYIAVLEHKVDKLPKSLTARYKLHICVYYQLHASIDDAMIREKEIKRWRKEKKFKLINTSNPGWIDLWEEAKKN